jgi:hypothetical protein
MASLLQFLDLDTFRGKGKTTQDNRIELLLSCMKKRAGTPDSAFLVFLHRQASFCCPGIGSVLHAP